MYHRQAYIMSIPYRIRRNLQRFFLTLALLTLVALAIFAAWVLWLNRYVVYTQDGAKLDFSLSYTHPTGQLAQPPVPGETVNITYGDSSELLDKTTELAQFVGYSVSIQMLTENFSGVEQALSDLPAGTPVLLDVKNYRGEFFYSSALGRSPKEFDTTQVDRLIRTLQNKGCYLIARIPAFRDYWYFLEDEAGRVPFGLPKAGGSGGLWLDKTGPSYWFNPTSTGTLNYLVQVIAELRVLGFDEVVLSEFRFPDTDQIVFSGDKAEALNQAAYTLARACSSDTFAVSFVGSHIQVPSLRCRVYLEDVPAADIPSVLPLVDVENPQAQVVFLTQLLDTRYEAYSVMRPLDLPED